MNPIWLNRAEAAEHLRVDVTTIDRYVKKGLITKYGGAGVSLARFDRNQLDALLVPVEVSEATG